MNLEIKNKLLEYQIPHVYNIIKSLERYNRALDASDTGTGKTYSSIAVAMLLKLKPFVICPKSVISSWLEIFKYMGCEYYGVVNYELLQNCKYYNNNGNKEKCGIITRRKFKTKSIKGKVKYEYLYIWKNIPNDIIIIFDEAHRCKNVKTSNAGILKALTNITNVKILMLSATISDKPENFALFGYILGLYRNLKLATKWINKVGKNYQNKMTGVHKVIYPRYASRMRIRDLGKLFPKNQVVAKCYDMKNDIEIQKQYDLIEDVVEELKTKANNTVGLGHLIILRQKIEMLKVISYLELARKYLGEGLAVAMFVNFTQTLEYLATELKTQCVVYGKQSIETRNKNIADFNSDESHIIICNIRAGGVGISLHDKHGNYPRISIISPSWSAQDIIQALGRVHRAKSVTPVRQRIVFAKKTVEEDICKNMKHKINNIGSLNDGDMQSYIIEGLTDQIKKEIQLTNEERIIKRLAALKAKKDRLENDLNRTNNDIATLSILCSVLKL